ncbi:outer membrane lipid asymmetry maintenance protein MlaD [Oceanobacter mangrovi]|uniref:outer membrane lipid asymmetry maintenance protein MlaD n=1 Tax=Oceanobacter mangrovi TaxID=2862510 RepID=UPI001C8EB170|nr:outer membrane lipid asymmetry maintenance protein MlaD [Oceanobacter mangrovi]
MHKRTVEFTVGAFMVMGIVALVLMAFRVSGLSMSDTGDTYTLKAHFENLGGLNERAKVSMAGVTIGRVTKIYLDPEWYSAVVEMEINKSMSTLSKDTSAAILTAGLLGEKYIGLTVGAEEEHLKDGDWIEDTQSALVLEELIGRFLFNKAEEG